MSEMVERVALVIKAAHRDAGPVGLARAIISAMREPTEAMLDAGWHEGGEDISAMWRAMIDAAPDAAQEESVMDASCELKGVTWAICCAEADFQGRPNSCEAPCDDCPFHCHAKAALGWLAGYRLTLEALQNKPCEMVGDYYADPDVGPAIIAQG